MEFKHIQSISISGLISVDVEEIAPLQLPLNPKPWAHLQLLSQVGGLSKHAPGVTGTGDEGQLLQLASSEWFGVEGFGFRI